MGQKMLDVFKKELEQIRYAPFRGEVIKIINTLPDYVLTIPSSSSGKYHPLDEIKEDGMIRHIKRFAIAADEMVRMYYDESAWYYKYKDILIATAILHDALKQGSEKAGGHTVKEHPIYIYDIIKKYSEDTFSDSNRSLIQESEYSMFDEIKERLHLLGIACLYHEGRWTIPESFERYPKDKLNSVEKRLVMMAHLADYIASRRSFYDMMKDSFMENK